MEVLDLAGLGVGMEAEAGVVGMEDGEDTLAGLLGGAGVVSMVDTEAGEDTMVDTMIHSFSALAQDFGRDITGEAITRIIGGGPMDTTPGGLMDTMPDGLTKGGPTIQRE